jgi:DNA repair exonuclease SbcCD ATPase subunit
MTPNQLIRFTIAGFKGVVAFEAVPNGKSLTIRGKNGAGKSSVIDALFWALGGQLDGEVINNGAEVARVDVTFGDYLITRRQARGKKPTLEVKSADGRAKFASPTALLSGFVGAVERRTFSARSGKERAEVLRKLAPGLDCADLDRQRAAAYDERTGVNRDARTLRAQAEGVVVPASPAALGEERPIVDVVDVAAIAAKKGDVEKVRAANAEARRKAESVEEETHYCENRVESAQLEVDAAEKALRQAAASLQQRRAELEVQRGHLQRVQQAVAALVDPDTSAIDAEIAAAREQNAAARRATEEHNRQVRAAQQQAAEVKRAQAERERLERQAAERETAAKKLTERIEQLDAEKAARLAAAALPIPGIALAGDVVTFDDGKAGPVELEALNTASRIRLDVAIAAALGHRLVAVRDASLLDAEERAAVDAFAAERGVQLLAEVVVSGEPLSAVIEEAAPLDPAVQAELGDF